MSRRVVRRRRVGAIAATLSALFSEHLLQCLDGFVARLPVTAAAAVAAAL